MRIGLNATCLTNKSSGAKQRFVGIYRDLVMRLSDVEFVIYESEDCNLGACFDAVPNVKFKRTPLSNVKRLNKFVIGLGYWHKALPPEKFAILEGFNLPLIRNPAGRTILTIHDIRGMRSESGYLERAAYGLVLQSSLQAADHVITVSEAIKREIIEFSPGISISVIHNGINSTNFAAITEADLKRFQRKYALPESFILAVGHLERRKNYLRLIDAMSRLRDRGSSCYLLIVGNDSGERKVIEERIKSARLMGSVMILSELSDFEVRCAYKLCTLFVFPSSYEGFGIPILEAMAAKRPMVLSDIPVFREITQDKGVYFAHDDTESMASSIETVLLSNSESDSLIAYGEKRINAFSFQNLSGQLASLYKQLL